MSVSDFLDAETAIVDDPQRRCDSAIPRAGADPSPDFPGRIRVQLTAFRAYFRKTPEWGLARILRRCLIAARLLLLHPIGVLRVVKALTGPKLSNLVQGDPIVFLKFSWPVYANGLSTASRAVIFSNHYELLQRRLTRDFLDKIVFARATLWEASMEGSLLAICLTVAPPTYGEGELTLHFQVDALDVYILSFVVVPARLMGVDAGHAIYVTHLQGIRGHGDPIKRATKLAGDVSPPLVLMAAVQGIALALDVKHILGICAREQTCSVDDPPTRDFASAYDEFWRSIEGRQLACGAFHFSVPLPEKALPLIKQNHRPRVRARRAFRRAVSDRVRAQIARVRVH